MWFCVFIFWASITEWKCSLKVFWQLTAARARLNNNNIVLWICMAFCQGENWIIVCFYRWHEQRDGVRVLADRLLTRLLVHSTFSDELWLWCFWTHNFEKYSVPCILRESQRREKPLGKLVGMTTIGRETEAREKVVGYYTTKPQQWKPQLVKNGPVPLLMSGEGSCCSRIALCTLAETTEQLVGTRGRACAPVRVCCKAGKSLRRKTRNNCLKPLQHLPQAAHFSRNNQRALQPLKSGIQARCRTTHFKGLCWHTEPFMSLGTYLWD